MQDLYGAILNNVPEEQFKIYEDRKEKRLNRFFQLKDDLMDEIVEMKINLQK